MSLLLCRQEQVKHPYYIENLGIYIYSSQEICYVIYHHPLLAMDGFFDEKFLEFLKDELDMGFTALKLERWLKSGENRDEALFLFLQECDYYSTAEINKFRQKVSSLRKLPLLEYAKQKADYLFQFKQYGKAIAGYREILESTQTGRMGDVFLGKVWHNLGAAYARVFQFDKALDSMDRSYLLLNNLDVLQKIYYLTLQESGIELKESYQSILTEDMKTEWNLKYKEAKERALDSAELMKLDELFARDSIKRMEGVSKMIREWKKEYRSMA